MKKRVRKGYCNECGKEINYSNILIPLVTKCPLCGARIISMKTKKKLIAYTITDDYIFKTVSTLPEGGKWIEDI